MDIHNKQELYKIVLARDKRYDGRFYCGVQTTGIYCRPICPARPKIENILFFRSATEAENMGYRACMRCRPDLAPNSAQWNGTAAVVGRALAMISNGTFENISWEDVSQKLGVSDRHLRRLFEEHIGASPIEVANSKKLHLARQLLTESSLSITEIAFASGYKSIRRFNEAFQKSFKASPRDIRNKNKKSLKNPSHFINVTIPVIPPFHWSQIYSFLKRHRAEGVESFEAGTYRRAFVFEETEGAIETTYDSNQHHLLVSVYIQNPTYLRSTIERLKDLFDVRLNPHAHLTDSHRKDPIWTCYKKSLGLRVPGAWDPFETAVSIILGQLVSVEQSVANVKKLIEKYGKKISTPVFNECHTLFPSPDVLSQASLKELGITKMREKAIQELAQRVLEKKIDLSRSSEIKKTKQQLLEIKGIGPWTAEMIAMRCLGDSNALPKSDLIIQRALQFHKKNKGDWSPWNSYITVALWNKYGQKLSRKTQKM